MTGQRHHLAATLRKQLGSPCQWKFAQVKCSSLALALRSLQEAASAPAPARPLAAWESPSAPAGSIACFKKAAVGNSAMELAPSSQKRAWLCHVTLHVAAMALLATARAWLPTPAPLPRKKEAALAPQQGHPAHQESAAASKKAIAEAAMAPTLSSQAPALCCMTPCAGAMAKLTRMSVWLCSQWRFG